MSYSLATLRSLRVRLAWLVLCANRSDFGERVYAVRILFSCAREWLFDRG